MFNVVLLFPFLLPARSAFCFSSTIDRMQELIEVLFVWRWPKNLASEHLLLELLYCLQLELHIFHVISAFYYQILFCFYLIIYCTIIIFVMIVIIVIIITWPRELIISVGSHFLLYWLNFSWFEFYRIQKVFL